MIRVLSLRQHKLLCGFIAGTFLALICLGLSLLLPPLITADYYEKSLGGLRKQARAIKSSFSSLESGVNLKMQDLLRSPFPAEKEHIFRLFQKAGINPDIEGLAYYDEDGNLGVWLGNVVDFSPSSPASSLIVRNKASVYLLSAHRIRQSEYVVMSRLLAFLPPLKAPYLEDYHFLKSALQRSCHVDYWDFREDVSGFERIFARHKDEYIGQPRLRSEIQTIFFPIRNSRGEIVATVNLSSPSLHSSLSSLREKLVLAFTILSLLSLSFLVIHMARAYFFAGMVTPLYLAILLLALSGLRLIFLQIGGLEKMQSLSVFSPAVSGFISLGSLTKSPADIFLTSLFLLIGLGCLSFAVHSVFQKNKLRFPPVLTWPLIILAMAAPVIFVSLYEKTLSRLVFNSNLNLLRFRFDPAFFLLHLGLVFLLLGLCLLLWLAFRLARALALHPWKPLAVLLLAILLRFFLHRNRTILVPLLEAAGLIFLWFAASEPARFRKKEVIFAALLLAGLFNSVLLRAESDFRLRSLFQNFLHETIISQEKWADFFLRQSILSLERKDDAIRAFLESPMPGSLARSLWEDTLAARFNWYSTLEILDADGEILSRFSLNIPQLFRPDVYLPLSKAWSVSWVNVPSLGKEREFVLGYKDWFSDEHYLGRTAFYLAVDPEMLPFLYSANPYFELLKVSSLPSLHQEEFGFAIFDTKGKITFNPNRISSGISPELLERLVASRESVWSRFQDRNRSYEAFYFRLNGRIYSFFAPRPGFLALSVEFLKLFFFYVGLTAVSFVLACLIRGKNVWRNFFWSFSSRVYAAFVTITLTSLLLFSLFSHNFFSRLFHQRFIEKAEIHANFARNVMQDFAFLQEEEKTTLIAPTDDLVLWISSAIGNDVSLYSGGRLVSSSRREFFDWGLLPELIDGETHYQIWQANKPFHTQRQKIGSYSFQSLTIPYRIFESQFLISLPFPFEEEEIARATEELVEFLVFIAVFFVGLVLLFARGMGRMIISPVQKLLAGTREVSLGNLDISIEHRSHDEMKTLIDGFNAMIRNLKQHQQEIADLSKKAAWAEMAQKVAHEIKNPLTPIQLSAEHLLRVYEDRREDFKKAIQESVSYIISEVENLRRIAQEFLELSRVTSLKKEPFDLRAVVEEVVSPYKKMLTERIKFREVWEGQAFPVLADRSKIKIAFRNIFINAIEAISGKGVVEIRLAASPGGWRLQVKDSGPGMEKEVQEKIFDPYFSTKEVGTGLGLPIAKKIVEDHGGSIRVESEAGKGTTITLTLPPG